MGKNWFRLESYVFNSKTDCSEFLPTMYNLCIYISLLSLLVYVMQCVTDGRIMNYVGPIQNTICN